MYFKTNYSFICLKTFFGHLFFIRLSINIKHNRSQIFMITWHLANKLTAVVVLMQSSSWLMILISKLNGSSISSYVQWRSKIKGTRISLHVLPSRLQDVSFFLPRTALRGLSLNPLMPSRILSQTGVWRFLVSDRLTRVYVEYGINHYVESKMPIHESCLNNDLASGFLR